MQGKRLPYCQEKEVRKEDKEPDEKKPTVLHEMVAVDSMHGLLSDNTVEVLQVPLGMWNSASDRGGILL